jgi:hypothetical protein
MALILIGASSLDHSLLLRGHDVGLLQHPGIWSFLGLQIALPISIYHSIGKLQGAGEWLTSIRPTGGASHQKLQRRVIEFVRLRNRGGRATASVLYSAGIAAFVWNTYQNQRPGVLVPFDFWDSATYPWGFWATRFYKLYLFGWLLPYVALVHVGILKAVLRHVHDARLSGSLRLVPFHPDGVGGLGLVPSIVSTPVAISLLAAAVPMAAALEVHRGFAVTPLIGITLLLALILGAYLLPIWYLRRDIVALKRDLVDRLRNRQQAYYARIADTLGDEQNLSDANQALEYFDKVCLRIQAISNYPHFKKLMAYTGAAITPSVVSTLLKLYSGAAPLIHPFLVRP